MLKDELMRLLAKATPNTMIPFSGRSMAEVMLDVHFAFTVLRAAVPEWDPDGRIYVVLRESRDLLLLRYKNGVWSPDCTQASNLATLKSALAGAELAAVFGKSGARDPLVKLNDGQDVDALVFDDSPESSNGVFPGTGQKPKNNTSPSMTQQVDDIEQRRNKYANAAQKRLNLITQQQPQPKTTQSQKNTKAVAAAGVEQMRKTTANATSAPLDGQMATGGGRRSSSRHLTRRSDRG